jgi:hypothetical protein
MDGSLDYEWVCAIATWLREHPYSYFDVGQQPMPSDRCVVPRGQFWGETLT